MLAGHASECGSEHLLSLAGTVTTTGWEAFVGADLPQFPRQTNRIICCHSQVMSPPRVGKHCLASCTCFPVYTDGACGNTCFPVYPDGACANTCFPVYSDGRRIRRFGTCLSILRPCQEILFSQNRAYTRILMSIEVTQTCYQGGAGACRHRCRGRKAA